MPAPQSKKVRDGIAMLRADPTLTRYQVAQRVGVTPGAFYNSRECKKLFQQRKKGQKK